MKISIKEIKVEHDGSELLYVRDIGFIVKSDIWEIGKEIWKQTAGEQDKIPPQNQEKSGQPKED